MELSKYIRWPLGCLIFLCSCTTASSRNEYNLPGNDSIIHQHRILRSLDTIAKMEKLVQTGDLITRTGNDFTSYTFRSMSQRDKTYSHCGIASVENDTVFVYHALGGEWNPDQKILRETFSQFVEPYNNFGSGVFRLNLKEKNAFSIIKQVKEFYSKKIMFDMDFDLTTDDRMYCAEFVVKSITRGTNNAIRFTPATAGGINYYAVDDIFLHPASKRVASVVYK